MNEKMIEMLNALRTQIKEDNQESLKSVEQNITQRINQNFDEKFCRVEKEINEIKKTQEEHEKRLDDFDKKIRQRNLIIFGIMEEEKSYQELEELVLQIINIKLEVECNRAEIEFVGRMGKKSTKPRPIRLTTTTYGKKIAILQNKKALEGSGAYIKEDFPPKVLDIRKSLLPQLNEQREKGFKAYLKYDKIITKQNYQENPNKRALSNSPSGKIEGNTSTGAQSQISKKTKTSAIIRSKTHRPTQGTNQTITSFMKKTTQIGNNGTDIQNIS